MCEIRMIEMKLKFTKEILETYYFERHGYLAKCKLYKVFDNDIQTGLFLYNRTFCYFSFAERQYRVLIERHYFKKSKYYLIDEKTNVKVGEYKLSNWLRDTGWLIMDDQRTFVCDKLQPEVRRSIFKRSTWGYYKINLSDRVSSVMFRFKIDVPLIASKKRGLRPFSGEIEVNGDIMLAFAGLFLLEEIFEIEDKD